MIKHDFFLLIKTKYFQLNLTESVSEYERSVAALTGLPRTEWAQILTKHFSSGINHDNMEIIKKAICMVIFDRIFSYFFKGEKIN